MQDGPNEMGWRKPRGERRMVSTCAQMLTDSLPTKPATGAHSTRRSRRAPPTPPRTYKSGQRLANRRPLFRLEQRPQAESVVIDERQRATRVENSSGGLDRRLADADVERGCQAVPLLRGPRAPDVVRRADTHTQDRKHTVVPASGRNTQARDVLVTHRAQARAGQPKATTRNTLETPNQAPSRRPSPSPQLPTPNVPYRRA